jgi:tetratricopeptide (TPR) repeat protein
MYEEIEQQAIQSALDANWSKAIKINNQLVTYGLETVAVYNRLGKAYTELDQWDKAVKAFEKALVLDPVNSVATKGLSNAKIGKRAGIINPGDHHETLLQDGNTTKIIEIKLKNVRESTSVKMVASKKQFYFLVNSETGTKLKRISKSKIGIKQELFPPELQAKILEKIGDGLFKIKISCKDPIFRSEKQQIDPSISLKSKEIIEEKKEIEKIMEVEREED